MPNTLGIEVISRCVPEVITPEKPALFGIRGMPVRYCAVEVVNKSPDIGLVDRKRCGANNSAIIVYTGCLSERIRCILRVEQPNIPVCARGFLRLERQS